VEDSTVCNRISIQLSFKVTKLLVEIGKIPMVPNDLAQSKTIDLDGL
jgi:hypothetical protein